MKFWQLVSMFGSASPSLHGLLADPRWAQQAQWLRDYREIVAQQQRDVLDAAVPDELRRLALEVVGLQFFLKRSNINVYRDAGGPGRDPADPVLTAAEVYDRYGPNAIEEILEYGSIQVGATDATSLDQLFTDGPS